MSPNYFATSGTPLLAGRYFRDAHFEEPRRVIVNQALVRRYLVGRDPIGLHVWLESERDPYEIVGVGGDAKYVVALLVVAAPATFMPARRATHIEPVMALRSGAEFEPCNV